MNGITKTMRLDALRLISDGLLTIIALAVLPPFFGLLFRQMLGQGALDLLMGVIMAEIAMVTASLTMTMFVREDQNDHRRINAILPVSRDTQVAGRYLLMFIVDILAVTAFELCVLLLAILGTGAITQAALMAGVGLFGACMVTQAILMPLMYQFSSAKIAQIIVLIFMLLICVALVGGFMLENQIAAIIAWLTTHIFVSTLLTVLIAVAFVAAVVAASLSISTRINRSKEL